MRGSRIGNLNDRIIVSASPKQLKKVLIGCGVAIVIAISILVYNLVLSKNYVEVEAQVVQIIKKNYPKNHSSTYTIEFQYTYEDKQYSAQQEQSNKPIDKQGDIVQIRCNPDNPAQIKDTPIIKTYSIIIVVLTALASIFYVMYRKVRKV